MKERPILFSGQMVRAILEGRKTQTRRIVKPQPPLRVTSLYGHGIAGHELEDSEMRPLNQFGFQGEGFKDIWACPFGKPGDRLWVRESWAKVPQTAYWHDQTIPHQVFDEDGYKWWAIYREGWERSSPGWKPSIHMPRWASRILLEVVSARAERLNDISRDDAFAEGVPCSGWSDEDWDDDGYPTPQHKRHALALEEYEALWESINGKGSWAENPWVWVIEFKVIRP